MSIISVIKEKIRMPLFFSYTTSFDENLVYFMYRENKSQTGWHEIEVPRNLFVEITDLIFWRVLFLRLKSCVVFILKTSVQIYVATLLCVWFCTPFLLLVTPPESLFLENMSDLLYASFGKLFPVMNYACIIFFIFYKILNPPNAALNINSPALSINGLSIIEHFKWGKVVIQS